MGDEPELHGIGAGAVHEVFFANTKGTEEEVPDGTVPAHRKPDPYREPPRG